MSTTARDSIVNKNAKEAKHRKQLPSPWFQISPDLKPRIPPTNAAATITNCGGSIYALPGQSFNAILYSGIETIAIATGMIIADRISVLSTPVFGSLPE